MPLVVGILAVLKNLYWEAVCPPSVGEACHKGQEEQAVAETAPELSVAIGLECSEVDYPRRT